MRALQRHLAQTLIRESAAYRVVDTTLVPAVVRVRACRRGLFAGQAAFGRCRSKTEWVYGFSRSPWWSTPRAYRIRVPLLPKFLQNAGFRYAPADGGGRRYHTVTTREDRKGQKEA